MPPFDDNIAESPRSLGADVMEEEMMDEFPDDTMFGDPDDFDMLS